MAYDFYYITGSGALKDDALEQMSEELFNICWALQNPENTVRSWAPQPHSVAPRVGVIAEQVFNEDDAVRTGEILRSYSVAYAISHRGGSLTIPGGPTTQIYHTRVWSPVLEKEVVILTCNPPGTNDVAIYGEATPEHEEAFKAYLEIISSPFVSYTDYQEVKHLPECFPHFVIPAPQEASYAV